MIILKWNEKDIKEVFDSFDIPAGNDFTEEFEIWEVTPLNNVMD